MVGQQLLRCLDDTGKYKMGARTVVFYLSVTHLISIPCTLKA